MADISILFKKNVFMVGKVEVTFFIINHACGRVNLNKRHILVVRYSLTDIPFHEKQFFLWKIIFFAFFVDFCYSWKYNIVQKKNTYIFFLIDTVIVCFHLPIVIFKMIDKWTGSGYLLSLCMEQFINTYKIRVLSFFFKLLWWKIEIF